MQPIFLGLGLSGLLDLGQGYLHNSSIDFEPCCLSLVYSILSMDLEHSSRCSKSLICIIPHLNCLILQAVQGVPFACSCIFNLSVTCYDPASNKHHPFTFFQFCIWIFSCSQLIFLCKLFLKTCQYDPH